MRRTISYDNYFTWPLTLFAAFQLTLLVMVWAKSQASSRRHSGLYSRAVLLAFSFLCLGYFLLCHRLSHSMEWMFLVGFLPASVLAIPAAHSLYHQRGWLTRIVWVAAAFSCYYWMSASVNWWLRWRG